MQYRYAAIAGCVALVLGTGACKKDAGESSTAGQQVSRDADRAADLQRQRDDDINRLDQRMSDVERKYSEKSQQVERGARTATTGLREELKEDVTNAREAVNNLRSTTAENWWDRHESAMKRTADDVEADVKRLAGSIPAPHVADTTGTTGEGVSTAPFTSRRDQFVAALRARVDAMEQALDKVKADGARETELDDTRARVKKLAEDVDRLRSAEADDWWDVTKARVTDYVDRVESSVGRLDDNRK